MNRMTLISQYIALVSSGIQKKKWTAIYLPLSDGETGEIRITLYADTYEEAHALLWKYKPEHYYNSTLIPA